MSDTNGAAVLTSADQPAGQGPWYRQKGAWVAGVVVLLVGVGIGGAGAEDEAENADPKPRADADATSAVDEKEPETTTTTEPEPYTPMPADFQLAVVVVEQSCFGSAGCNVTYDLDLTYIGPRPLDSSDTWTVVYEIHGGEDPKVGNVQVTGSEYRKPRSDFVQTPRNPQLTAVPTAVRPG